VKEDKFSVAQKSEIYTTRIMRSATLLLVSCVLLSFILGNVKGKILKKKPQFLSTAKLYVLFINNGLYTMV